MTPEMPEHPIQRVWEQVDNTQAYYYDPPAALYIGAESVEVSTEASSSVLTCVLWVLGARPASVTHRHLELTPEEVTRAQAADANAKVKQAMVFTGMAGLMVLAKELIDERNRGNFEYLTKRWSAVCAANSLDDYFARRELKPESFITGLLEFQNWIKVRAELRNYLVKKGLGIQLTGPLGSVIDQVRLVWGFSGMKAAQVMNAYLRSGNGALMVPAVAEQAVTFKRAFDSLQTSAGPNFPYAQLLRLAGIETLHHRKYPDLYYAAVSVAIESKTLGVEGRFKMTEVETVGDKKMIDEFAQENLNVDQGVSETTRQHLRDLGYQLREGDSEPFLKRRRH
ncbi:nucleocapsid protein [Hymenopteran orino-related virus OKIAV87]|uniref:Nucleocapsid protein n=1 Tax=Hymenopteran orino-related virus OKIAV87 TaxID=2746371 RepID=A0A7D7F0U3_9MONO|nr:nucleocapsid protein [Hymenopteran orino-related virus OKIAV87]QMP82159.1 nucleocapsid protein [Hymenopteran orino-related virus OKIAV87]